VGEAMAARSTLHVGSKNKKAAVTETVGSPRGFPGTAPTAPPLPAERARGGVGGAARSAPERVQDTCADLREGACCTVLAPSKAGEHLHTATLALSAAAMQPRLPPSPAPAAWAAPCLAGRGRQPDSAVSRPPHRRGLSRWCGARTWRRRVLLRDARHPRCSRGRS